MTPQKWNKVLKDYSMCSDRLEKAVRDLTEEQLDIKPEGGGWTPRQIIHHLADGVLIWSMFIHQALAGQDGEFNLHWYWDRPQEEWAEIWNYGSREIDPALEIYRANQNRMLPLLETIPDPDELTLLVSIQGLDPDLVSVQDAVRIQILHLKEHLADIRKVLGQDTVIK